MVADDSDEAGRGERESLGRTEAVTAASAHSRPRNRAERSAKLSSLAMRVRERYAALSPGERTVADLILAFPGRLATHSATELAQLAGASKATVTRCFRRLGYASYAEVRSEVRREQLWGSPYYLEQGASQWSSPHLALEAHVAADSELLGATVDALTAVDLGAVVAALGQARRVVFIGYRNSHLLAAYASSQLALLRPGVELLPRVAETLAGGLAGLGPEDLVVAVGFRRRVQAFQAALEAVHGTGARVLYVTDLTGTAGSLRADWTLTAHCRGASMLDSYVAAISLLNFLVTQVARELGDAARQRMAQIEQLHGELGDLV